MSHKQQQLQSGGLYEQQQPQHHANGATALSPTTSFHSANIFQPFGSYNGNGVAQLPNGAPPFYRGEFQEDEQNGYDEDVQNFSPEEPYQSYDDLGESDEIYAPSTGAGLLREEEGYENDLDNLMAQHGEELVRSLNLNFHSPFRNQQRHQVASSTAGGGAQALYGQPVSRAPHSTAKQHSSFASSQSATSTASSAAASAYGEDVGVYSHFSNPVIQGFHPMVVSAPQQSQAEGKQHHQPYRPGSAGGDYRNNFQQQGSRTSSPLQHQQQQHAVTTASSSSLRSNAVSGASSAASHHQQDAYLQKYAQQSAVQQQAFTFRSQYLSLCEKNLIEPSQDLLRALKNSIRSSNNTFSRLSVCHAGMDDLHVKVIVTALKNSRVETLNEILLNHNNITDEGASLIAKNLYNGPSCFAHIVSLELFGNQMGDDCCKEMGTMLNKNITLKRLKLGDNKITPTGANCLAEGLKSNTTLTQLHMGGNKILAEGLQKLCDLCLVNNSTLTSLGLRDNDVGAEGMKALAKALMQTTCALSDIQLKGNRILAQGAVHLAQALSKNQSLKVLELQSNSIGAVGVQALCGALQQNRSVHALNFNDNDLGCEGAIAVANLLIKNPSITTLGLANNRIRKKGAIALAKSLGGMVQREAALASTVEATLVGVAVTGLDLGNNELGNSGAVALAENLKTNTVLTSLDLRACEIHLKGMLALAEMTAVNTTLRHLDLGSNYAKNQGAQAFANVLAKNTSLTRLCLTDNQIYHEGGEALAIGLQSNYTLRNFSYGGQGQAANRIDSQIRRIIDSIVNENKRHWELNQGSVTQQPTQQQQPSVPYNSNNHYRYINIPATMTRMRAQQQTMMQPPSVPSSGTAIPNATYNNFNGFYSGAQFSSSPLMSSPMMNSAVGSSASVGGASAIKSSSALSSSPNQRNFYGNGTGGVGVIAPPTKQHQQQPQRVQSPQQMLPSWFTSHNTNVVIDTAKLDTRLEFLFTNKLLKAENPKFPGCYFIGNIINTLRKVFPDTPRSLDEIELVRFAYHSPKYYVHISREMVKTQMKYVGNGGNSTSSTNMSSSQQQSTNGGNISTLPQAAAYSLYGNNNGNILNVASTSRYAQQHQGYHSFQQQQQAYSGHHHHAASQDYGVYSSSPQQQQQYLGTSPYSSSPIMRNPVMKQPIQKQPQQQPQVQSWQQFSAVSPPIHSYLSGGEANSYGGTEYDENRLGYLNSKFGAMNLK